MCENKCKSDASFSEYLILSKIYVVKVLAPSKNTINKTELFFIFSEKYFLILVLMPFIVSLRSNYEEKHGANPFVVNQQE